MSQLSVVSASRKQPVEEEDDKDYSAPPAKIERDAFGYVASGKTGPKVGCHSCFYYDAKEHECELFEMVQDELPNLFSLDKVVADNAGCEAHVLVKGK